MVPSPADSVDLDVLTDQAIGSGTPNFRFHNHFYINKISLLVAVCVAGRLDLAERLFKAGATMSADELAHVIWWSGGAQILWFLLERGVPHNAACLQSAIRHDNWDAVFALLDYGADVQTSLKKYDVNLNLLHFAAWQGNNLAVRILLQRGAIVDYRDGEDSTPLIKACDFVNNRGHQRGNPATAYLLLQGGADPNARNQVGTTALLSCTGMPEPYNNARTNVAQVLLKYGAAPNVFSLKGTTPLMFAARDNDVPLARALLRAGADIEARTPDGKSALDVAVHRGSADVAAMLRDL